MEEADAFIKEACKHLECSFADDEEIEFTTPQLFEFLVRCIWKIDSSSKTALPSHVYPNVITTRLHRGNAISNYLQKFHIRGDTALHTVLYGSINNLRSAIIELIRKLPASAHEIVNEDKGHDFLVKTLGILDSQQKWVPVYCRNLANKKEWKPEDDQPEIFKLCSDEKSKDPRKWIVQYINGSQQNAPSKRPKPALPPKPVFGKLEKENPIANPTEYSAETTDENAVLEAEYEEKMIEYKKMQDRRQKIEEQNEELRRKLAEYDPELVETLQDPERYAEMFLTKISELNKQMEEDEAKIEASKKESAKKNELLIQQMKEMGVQNEELKRMEEMEIALEDIDQKIESNHLQAEKLRTKLQDADEDNFYEYEQRSKDLDEMVRKQEFELIKMQEERATLRKQQERDNEAVDRSFAIIYNILLQHCDNYRGRLAMESFTRIHLYCLEIMEMLRENGALKHAVGCLQAEIAVEEHKQYDKQFELLSQDYREVARLNEELATEIRRKDPSFQLPLV